MKKQQKTYLLLIAVLIIWGMIGFQIFKRLNPSTPKLESLIIQKTFQKKKLEEQKFYKIKEAYRDPFLGKFPIKKKKVKKKIVIKKRPIIPFPIVIYNGIIEGDGSKQYILTINGKQEIIKLGETFFEVKLIKANTEEIVVQFLKEKKTITKQ